MKPPSHVTRRNFMKSSALASVAVMGAATVSGCSPVRDEEQVNPGFYIRESLQVPGHYSGLLFSQVGYEAGMPVRVIIRLPESVKLTEGAACRLNGGGRSHEAPVVNWGECWGSGWWIATFTGVLEEGSYAVEVIDEGELAMADKGLLIRRDILWESTIEYASADMLERRAHFTKVGAGWQDAGTLWVESCAQSAMIIGLEDLLEKASGRLSAALIDRVEKQITVGCDYLVMTQKKARELGYPDGAFTHDLHGHEHDILPNDANKAVVALLRASRLLSDRYAKQKKTYRETGEKAFQWLIHTARPLGRYGFQPFQRGLPPDILVPPDEWATRDLVMMCWASLERWKIFRDEASGKICRDYAGQILKRQISREQPELGFYGHFYEYSSLKHSESAWVHGIVPAEGGGEFGTDIGGFYPHYLLPIVEMIRIWPDDPDAGRWREMLIHFVNGYLKPACQANPFYLAPLGIFGEEGPIWFCGTFHGTNAVYGYTAALALELSALLGDEELKQIAYGNLQWIAGLNGGITREGVRKGCVVFSMDLPENLALPASMICHIGQRWAGTWFQTRGVICNGFSTGEQFQYDVAVKRANDGPYSLTDEDWIPHSAGWISGIIRLGQSMT